MVADWSSPRVGRGPEVEDPPLGANFPGSKTRHGTTSGFTKHQYRGEEPCEPCRQAKAAYDYRRLSGRRSANKNRMFAKAQKNALRRLKNAHPQEYKALYEEEKDILQNGGGTP